MRRYWVDQELHINKEIEITGDLFRHIFSVCRQDVGDEFELLNDSSQAYFVRVVKVGKKSAQVAIVDKRTIVELPRPHIRLLLSMPKFSKFEEVLEKSVELGVKQVTPLFSEHSFIGSENKISDGKWQRWRKIIKSATQQSGRGDLMALGKPQKFAEMLDEINLHPGISGLLPYEGKSALSTREALSAVDLKACSEIWLFVGSEGGFSAAEIELAHSANLLIFSMGEQVLRVETACVALLGILKYELNLLESIGGN